ncbi:hypothetical protein DVH24_040645 [Malus domestica]|uniref:Hemimethylated DNA-binding domain-containing protein n=1 Tax=Malus domestica TaxID=3750 RepID=A0A498I6Y7_MALDO|nr:hypothetical protein DVH24_040645 [Malus domestica]
MVQGLSLSTLTAFRYGGLCGSMPSWRKQFKLMSKTPISSGVERCGIWHLGCQSLFVRGKTDVLGGCFKGGDQGLNASSERSESANEDILIFFFQLDLATRVQVRWGSFYSEVVLVSLGFDILTSIFFLGMHLQYALNTEQYDVAQQLRNKLTEAIELWFVEWIRSWMETAQVEKLTRGSNQPFYQILVDVHADPNLLVAYVSEENLLAPEEPDVDRFDHPYISFLFYGMDAAGYFIPIRQLREKCNRPRHEIPYDPLDEGQGSDA